MDKIDVISRVPGLISEETGRTLALLASHVDPLQAIVNIGVFKGRSTFYLCMGAGENGPKVWAIDPWDLIGNPNGKHGYASADVCDAFRLNVMALGYEERIVGIKGFATDVAETWDGPEVGLLFVDGDHSEESVRADYEAWRGFLSQSAIVVFDDFKTRKNPGVEIVVNEIIRHGDFPQFIQSHNLGVFKR
jgi:predicted O-methyltransferase YrrM